MEKAEWILEGFSADVITRHHLGCDVDHYVHQRRNTAATIIELGRRDSLDQIAELKLLFRTYIDMKAGESMSWDFMSTVTKALQED
jgi:hypothetical protein